MGQIEKMIYKLVKPYEDIEGLSAAKLDAWGRLTKKYMNNLMNQWRRMRLEKVVEEGSGQIEH